MATALTTMKRPSRQSIQVRDYILLNVASHPGDVASLARNHFGLSRTAISGHMALLVAQGFLTASGKTSARKYQRVPVKHEVLHFSLSKNSSEDTIWQFRILPLLIDRAENVVNICQYGFTEMLNNCIDHSGSGVAIIDVKVFYDEITIRVYDVGVGIFEKIRSHFQLVDARHALLELAKGKLTSDRKNHSGEGIFFTSRMFNRFSITSGHLFYTREMTRDDDWLIENKHVQSNTVGTIIDMTISTHATWTTREVFSQYQQDAERISFRKTHVPIRLGKYPNEELVSRSQAKRILARVGEFSEVILDFDGIDHIGQAFADEIFRVFQRTHPDIALISVRKSRGVQRMIDHVLAAHANVALGDDPSFFTSGLLSE